MGLRERLKDPWGAVLGAVAGGLAWAVIPGVAVAVPIGLGVAAVVYGAKVASGALVGRTERDPIVEGLRPKRGSAAEVWIGRSERAETNLEHLVGSCSPGPLKDQLTDIGQQAAGTITTIRRLGSQVAAVEQGLDRIPIAQIEAEHDRLYQAVRVESSAEVIEETTKALSSVKDQMDSYQRLQKARQALVARMESAALGLEGINTRTAELLAMSATSVAVDNFSGDGLLGELNSDLDALRAGLAESEAYTKRVLRPGDA